MAAGFKTLNLTGQKELIAALQALTPALEKKVLRQAMRKAAKPIHAQAKANAPVSKPTTELRSLASRTVLLGSALGATAKQAERAAKRAVKHSIRQAKKSGQHYPGTLRDSIKIRAAKSKKGRIGVIVQTKDGDYRGATFYGAFVEYGTSKMAARPYMRPAFDTKKADAAAIAEHEINAGIQRLAGELNKRG